MKNTPPKGSITGPPKISKNNLDSENSVLTSDARKFRSLGRRTRKKLKNRYFCLRRNQKRELPRLREEISKEKRPNPQKGFGAGACQHQDDDHKDDCQKKKSNRLPERPQWKSALGEAAPTHQRPGGR
jgi:hypothetical protein